MSDDNKTSDLRVETDSCIEEIEWFATRKKNLAEKVESRDYTWADSLLSDIKDLREAIANERNAR